MTSNQDAPSVIVFPPLIPLATVLLAIVMQWLVPFGWLLHLPLVLRLGIGAVVLVLGISFIVRGNRALARSNTNVNPSQPTTALVMTGVYAQTRNPLYVGGCIGMIGIAFLFALDWLLLLFPLSVAILHFGVVVREETYLAGKFGDEYRDYQSRVPCYLGLPKRGH